MEHSNLAGKAPAYQKDQKKKALVGKNKERSLSSKKLKADLDPGVLKYSMKKSSASADEIRDLLHVLKAVRKGEYPDARNGRI